MRASDRHDSPRRVGLALAAAIVVAFVVSRTALLLTSYDTNRNWEEPVFLLSATELQRDGVGAVFDHQDDLNHGASVVLLLLAVPWVSLLGTSLVALKGLAILWSALTLCVFTAVAWRYWSARVALLLAVFYLTLSPLAARLNVTLVGSHPEALLPCVVAWGAYWEWVHRRDGGSGQGPALDAALGWASGAAIWMAYMSAMFVAPLLVLRVADARRWQTAAALAGGLALGLAPWCYQDLWLRPHGALLWTQHLTAGHTATGLAQRWRDTLTQLAASFGYSGVRGVVLLAICGGAWMSLVLRLWRSRSARVRLAITPLVLAPPLGLAMLANSYHPVAEVEGYYHYRFYIPLQAALFWVLAVALDGAAERVGQWLTVTAAMVAVAVGTWAQAPLYSQGNHYHADFAQDRARGCHVFGIAEWRRSPTPAAAMDRLGGLPDGACRNRAFGGLGWGLGGQFLRDGDVARALATLGELPDLGLRWSMCGGFLFVVSRASEARVTAAQRTAAAQEVGTYCRGFRPS